MADLVNRIKQRLPNECLKKGKLTKEGCNVSLAERTDTINQNRHG